MGRPRTQNPHLPKNVYHRHGAYYLVTAGAWRRLGKEYHEAMATYHKIASAATGVPEFVAVTPGFLDELYRSVVKNAQRRSIACLVGRHDIDQMLSRSSWACEVTKIRFNLVQPEGMRIRPWAPSVDRIDSLKPYTAKNCQLVCAAYNIAKNEWPEPVWRTLIKGISSAYR